jgi:hypothetical protein
LRNTGTNALTITSLPISGPWQLVTPPALPATVAAGGTLDLTLRFVADGGSVWNGTLTIQSNDPTNPSTVVQLAGWWQSISEGGVEPSLTQLMQVFGYKTAITFPGQPLSQAGLIRNVGDEVLSPYWLRADTTKPVTVRQIAAYHGCTAGAGLFWHLRGSTALTGLFTSAKEDCQSLLPRLADLSGPATNTLAPGSAFGFTVDGLEWSDDTKNSTGADVSNGCAGPCGHHMRFWLVRDRSGAVVPNQYLMSMDYSGINYDYQDNVFLITNMRPAPPAQVIRRLDVGATANYTDTQGNVWTPDTGLFAPGDAQAEGASYAVQTIDWTQDDPLYITYRAFLGNIPQNQRILTYSIPLPAGVTKVDVRLHYAERFWTANGQRVFNLDVEGTRVSTGFDIFRYAPGAHNAMIVPVYNVSVTDGSLTLVFAATTDYAAVNAIEVFSNP